MKQMNRTAILMVVAGLVLTACAPAVKTQDAMMQETATDVMMEKTATPDAMMRETATPEMMEEKTSESMKPETATPEMMEETNSDAMMTPNWFKTELTNANTDETFTINDFKGKVVLVETFAQWCTTCLAQQKEVVKLHEMLGMPADLVTVGLDVDPNEDIATLKTYLLKNDFTWHYAITSADTAREIGKLYGDQFLNPPSAPMFIIDRHGEAHVLPFGVKSAEDLQKAVEPFLAGDM